MANLELRGNYGIGVTRSGNAGDRAAASRRQQMAMQEAMMQEQRYNTMRTEHLEADLVAQEKKEAEDDIYYLLT